MIVSNQQTLTLLFTEQKTPLNKLNWWCIARVCASASQDSTFIHAQSRRTQCNAYGVKKTFTVLHWLLRLWPVTAVIRPGLLLCPGRVAKYCDEYVHLCVCVPKFPDFPTFSNISPQRSKMSPIRKWIIKLWTLLYEMMKKWCTFDHK